MRRPHIAEMPRLARDARELRLFPAVTLNEAVFRRQGAEPAACAVVRQMRADEINVRRRARKVYGKARLMLAAAGLRHKLFCKRLALFAHGIVPNTLLLRARAPAGNGHNLPGCAGCAHTLGQQGRGRLFHQHVFRAQRRRKGRRTAPVWMPGVHQHQRAAAGICGRKRNAVHFCTPSSTSFSTSLSNGRPAARIMPG